MRSTAGRQRGRVLKQIGDEFMLMSAQPSDAIAFGLAMDRFVDAESQFPALHIGAHCGAVLYREGDYVRATVNLAARVASAGSAGQFLITEHVRDTAGHHPGVDFATLPPRRLKGIPDPICLVEVRRYVANRSQRETDPVCGMLLHPSDIASETTWAGTVFVFCSENANAHLTPNHIGSLPRTEKSRLTLVATTANQTHPASELVLLLPRYVPSRLAMRRRAARR